MVDQELQELFEEAFDAAAELNRPDLTEALIDTIADIVGPPGLGGRQDG